MKQSEKEDLKRARRLNSVLRAIRNVNQLITRENDPWRLIEGACLCMTETLGYESAWIFLFDNAPDGPSLSVSAHHEALPEFQKEMKAGKRPRCLQKALEKGGVVKIHNPSGQCPDCSLKSAYENSVALCSPLEFEGRVYGAFTVSIPEEFADDAIERELFEEAAGDVAFALRKIENSRKRDDAADVIKESEKRLRLAEAEARKSRRFLEFAIEQIPIPVIIAAAPDVEIMYFNQAAVDLLTKPEIDPHDIPLERHREFWPTFYPDGTPYTVEELPLTRAIKRGDVTKNAEIIVRKDDGDHWILANAAPLQDNDDNIIAGIVAFPEITERKKTREKINSLARFPDENPNPVLRLDAQGEILYANSSAEPLLNYWKENSGQSVPPDILDAVETTLSSGDGQSMEIPIKDRFLTLALAPIPEPGYVNIYALDITDRKEAEQKVQRMNVLLEERVRARTSALERANKELETFAYSVSHDLRAPLRAIQGFAEIIARRHKDSLKEEGRHYFDNIVEASTQMSDLIDDLLKYSRLGRRALKRQRIDAETFIEKIAGNYKDRIRESGAEVDVSAPLKALASDPTLLGMILGNLLQNALTYVREGVKPKVRVSCRAEGETAILSVEDNGVGIPKEHHDKIFNIFQRLQPQSKHPGAGVGLGLVKKAASLLGGDVTVESASGEGSVFTARLPGAVPTSEKS